MGNFIAIHVLKQYNPGTFNRGENGEAKQIIIGGVDRARFSSQCQKRAIRELTAPVEIRSAHIEKLISACLDIKVKDGTITDDEKNLIGNAICSKEVIGTKCWDKLKSKDDQESIKDLQGNIVVTTNADEINALISTFIEELKTNGNKNIKDSKKWAAIAKSAALSDVKISIAKSMYGTMATDGVLGTVDGAVQMGQAFSVDEYMPESDFFTVKFTGRAGADTSDPFFGVYESFSDIESQKTNGETINTGLSLYSNVMYSYANVNIKELERNLNTYVGSRKYVQDESIKSIINEEVPKFLQAMIEMVPEATQNRSSSHVEPAAVLIEVIKNGSNLQPDWNKCINATATKSVAELAIERLSKFANDDTFRSGEIRRYVMFGSTYGDYAKLFENAQQLNSFKDLRDKIVDELNNLM